MKDSYGKTIKVGDTIHFGYGIPTVGVNAPVIEEDGKLVAITKGHTPEKCSLEDLKKYVGEFWKVEDAEKKS